MKTRYNKLPFFAFDMILAVTFGLVIGFALTFCAMLLLKDRNYDPETCMVSMTCGQNYTVRRPVRGGVAYIHVAHPPEPGLCFTHVVCEE